MKSSGMIWYGRQVCKDRYSFTVLPVKCKSWPKHVTTRSPGSPEKRDRCSMWIMNSCFLELDTKAHCVRNVVINWETRLKEGSVCPPPLCLPWVSIMKYKDTLWIQPSIHSDVNLAPFLDVLLKLKQLRTSLYRKILSLSSSWCHDGFFQPSRCAWCDVFESALDFEQVEAETWLYHEILRQNHSKVICSSPSVLETWTIPVTTINYSIYPFSKRKVPQAIPPRVFYLQKDEVFFFHLAGWGFTERFGVSFVWGNFPAVGGRYDSEVPCFFFV